MKRLMNKFVLVAAMALFAVSAHAAKERFKPFIMADVTTGDIATVQKQVEKKLKDGGFEVVGSYSPYSGASVVAFTNDALKQNAAKSEFGGYGAALRVSITKVGNDIQVAYINPTYMAHAYRMASDLANITTQLEKVLGNKETFGASKGMRDKKLRKYHYMFGMEYFDDTNMHELAQYPNHKVALQTVVDNLKKGTGGVSQVYRIDVPGKEEVVFGVGMKKTKGGDKYVDDSYIMGIIDFGDKKGTAHLPYEIMVSGKKVYHLYARFRIAINFPDLSMMGDNSFMNIVESPEAIKKALTKIAGGEVKDNYWE
ncbi:MAG: hypothetical protein OEZ16_04735 [Chromatiales bacterium]|nr:hypothetical protein [Chromatiales bacterium]